MILSSVKNELHLLNAVIGLCKRLKSWPSTLADLGFEIFGVEVRFTNQDGTVVRPDTILLCRSRDHALVVECKSGSYVKENQIEAYPRISPHDLVAKALLPVGPGLTLRRDIVIFCLSAKFEQVKINLEKAAWQEPVIGLGDDSINLLMGSPTDVLVRQTFEEGISLSRKHRPPIHFIPFSPNAAVSTDADVASEVMTTIVSLTRKQGYRFTLSQLLDELMGDMWTLLGTDERQRFKQRTREIISQGIKTDLKTVLRPTRDEVEQGWEVVLNRFRSEAAAYRHLGLKVERFMLRLRAGQTYEPTGLVQMNLEDWTEEQHRRRRRDSNR